MILPIQHRRAVDDKIVQMIDDGETNWDDGYAWVESVYGTGAAEYFAESVAESRAGFSRPVGD